MALRTGDVVHVYVQSLRNPKHKYCVLVCIEPKPLFFLINSEITEYKKTRPDLMVGQLEIDAAGHAFLKYDSWLDCTELHGYPLDQLEAEYSKDQKVAVGRLSEVLRARVIEIVKRSITLPKRDIARILAALTPPPGNHG
ncbi:MAG: hypothetical protein WBM24_23125 [Candidatus Sulfotelmatobacter sp.]